MISEFECFLQIWSSGIKIIDYATKKEIVIPTPCREVYDNLVNFLACCDLFGSTYYQSRYDNRYSIHVEGIVASETKDKITLKYDKNIAWYLI